MGGRNRREEQGQSWSPWPGKPPRTKPSTRQLHLHREVGMRDTGAAPHSWFLYLGRGKSKVGGGVEDTDLALLQLGRSGGAHPAPPG